MISGTVTYLELTWGIIGFIAFIVSSLGYRNARHDHMVARAYGVPALTALAGGIRAAGALNMLVSFSVMAIGVAAMTQPPLDPEKAATPLQWFVTIFIVVIASATMTRVFLAARVDQRVLRNGGHSGG